MANFEGERARVFRRAESIYRSIDELLRNDHYLREVEGHRTFADRAREWCNQDPEGREFSREFTALIYDELGDVVQADQLDAWLCHGVVAGGVEHAWIVVEGDPNKVHPVSEPGPVTAEQIRQAGAWGAWRYLIDVCVPSTLPGLIMFAPPSPFQGFYHETERFREHPAPPPFPEDDEEARKTFEESIKRLLQGPVE